MRAILNAGKAFRLCKNKFDVVQTMIPLKIRETGRPAAKGPRSRPRVASSVLVDKNCDSLADIEIVKDEPLFSSSARKAVVTHEISKFKKKFQELCNSLTELEKYVNTLESDEALDEPKGQDESKSMSTAPPATKNQSSETRFVETPMAQGYYEKSKVPLIPDTLLIPCLAKEAVVLLKIKNVEREIEEMCRPLREFQRRSMEENAVDLNEFEFDWPLPTEEDLEEDDNIDPNELMLRCQQKKLTVYQLKYKEIRIIARMDISNCGPEIERYYAAELHRHCFEAMEEIILKYGRYELAQRKKMKP